MSRTLPRFPQFVYSAALTQRFSISRNVHLYPLFAYRPRGQVTKLGLPVILCEELASYFPAMKITAVCVCLGRRGQALVKVASLPIPPPVLPSCGGALHRSWLRQLLTFWADWRPLRWMAHPNLCPKEETEDQDDIAVVTQSPLNTWLSLFIQELWTSFLNKKFEPHFVWDIPERCSNVVSIL